MKALKIIAPIVVVLAGVAIVVALFVLRPRAEREPPKKVAPTARVQTLEADEGPRSVRVTGTVTAARAAALAPEVNGRVTFVSPALSRGGRVKKGAVLFRVDSRDYVIAVEQARALVEQARLQLTLEESRAEVAQQEWRLLGKEKDSALALRKPQMANARAQLASAEAGLRRAELSLARTTVRAPFDAFVKSESVEVGMIAAPGAQLVQLVGTEEVWVVAQVPLAAARTLRFADEGEDPSGATVRYRAGEESVESYEGKALRLLGEVDRETRTAQVVVVVKAPFAGEGLPLLPEAFVEVELDGAALAGAIKVPRVAVARGAQVFVVDDAQRLSPRVLEVVWRDREFVWASQGVAAGERVLITAIPYATEGLLVRVVEGAP